MRTNEYPWKLGDGKPRRLFTVLAVAMTFVAGAGPGWLQAQAVEPPKADVYVGGIDGYNTYRIPSLICTPKGTLLAFCEGRKLNADDQSPTDMVLKRSLDGGRTWQPMQVIVAALPDAAMDPTALVDHTTGSIVLIYDRWPENYSRSMVPGLGNDSVTTWITTSADEGVTWSAPRDITGMTKKAEWTETIHGPGIAIQLRSGRFVVPCSQLRPDRVYWNFVIFSDDHGQTWQRSDNEVGPGVDESQMVELDDGSLLLNMRSSRGKGCRAGATSKDGGKTWSELFEIPELSEPVCQGSILRYTWPDEQGGKSRILFCNPGNTGQRVGDGRNTGTVRLSYDEAKTWPVARVIDKEYFGYCCLTAMSDGSIGCLYESDNLRRIVFSQYSLDWLTDGKDCLGQ